jgi:hypothetical protein
MDTPAVAIGDRFWPAFFDLIGGPIEKKPPIRDARRKLLARAGGRVLEVGGGTGFKSHADRTRWSASGA